MEKLIVVIVTYKPFYFLTRICVASIRYYHPDAEIYIIKDNLAGTFRTTEMERAFDVRQLDLGVDRYGWSAAKLHLLASDKFAGQRVLSLDCDIVLIGRFLDKLYRETQDADFVVDADYTADVRSDVFKQHYYDIDVIREMDPQFTYPGYAFNGGQAVIRTGKVTRELLAPFFDTTTFPYYKRRDILPQADQSILNYLLPTLEQQGKIRIAPAHIMLWSDEEATQKLSLEAIKAGNEYPYLIHWAGVRRVPHLAAMTRADILHFFEDYYYSKVRFGRAIKRVRSLISFADYRLRTLYRERIRPLISK